MVKIDPLIAAGCAHLEIVGQLSFDEPADAVVGIVVQNTLIIAGENNIAFCADRDRRIYNKRGRAVEDIRIAIQIIEGGSGGHEIVMIVADLEKELVQIPQDRDAGGVFKAAVVPHAA